MRACEPTTVLCAPRGGGTHRTLCATGRRTGRKGPGEGRGGETRSRDHTRLIPGIRWPSARGWSVRPRRRSLSDCLSDCLPACPCCQLSRVRVRVCVCRQGLRQDGNSAASGGVYMRRSRHAAKLRQTRRRSTRRALRLLARPAVLPWYTPTAYRYTCRALRARLRHGAFPGDGSSNYRLAAFPRVIFVEYP